MSVTDRTERSIRRNLLRWKSQIVRFYKEQDTIEKKLFWSVVPLTAAAGLISSIFAFIERLGLLACLSGLLCITGPTILMFRCHKLDDCEKCYVEFCYLFNGVLMPLTFLANGGLDSGMPMYCFGSLLLCAFCTDKKKRFFCFGICACIYLAVFFLSHFMPLIVAPIREGFIWFDIVLSFLVSGICIWVIIGTAIEEYNSQRFSNVNNGLIDSLGAIIEFRSLETGNHVRNIKECTRILLEYANKTMRDVHFTRQEIAVISSASVLHDIGKIAVPDNVLQKPGRLTEDEYEIIKRHPEDGCKMIETLKDYQSPDYYESCYEICRHHHERYDGSGYPDKLKGEDIPLISQLVGLADVYEALTSKRIYKEAYDLKRAQDIILNKSPGQFSERVLDCFRAALPELEKYIVNSKPLPKISFSAGRSVKIGLCMKNFNELQAVNAMVLNYLENNSIRSSVEVYPHPDDLLEACKLSVFDIIIVSIENQLLNGIEIAKEALEYNKKAKFIYISDSDADALQAYQYNAVDYRVRPLHQNAITEALNKAFLKDAPSEKNIVLRTKSKLYILCPNDVVMTETDGHMQAIYTTSGEVIRIKKNSTEIFEILEPYGCFAKCGASYTLNLSHISAASTNLVTMSNHRDVIVPRRVYPELRKRYREYYRYKEQY